MNPFGFFSRRGDEWTSAGLTSSFPDLGDDDGDLSQPRPCNAETRPGCKVFHIPKLNSSQATEIAVTEDDSAPGIDLTDQVLVYQYRGKFHAIDHQCPHSSFPLSKGIPFDVEDFGIVLSAGITCPKHAWSFDVHSGMADRGNYRLKIWEVQLREIGSKTPAEKDSKTPEKEVWVRRKQRIG